MEEYSPMYLNLCYTYKKSVLMNKGKNKNYGLISNIIPTFTLPNGTCFLQTNIHFTSISEFHHYIDKICIVI